MCTNRHRIINNQAFFFVSVLEHSLNIHSVDATLHFLGEADYYSMHKKLQLELIDKCLDTVLSSIQGQDNIAET